MMNIATGTITTTSTIALPRSSPLRADDLFEELFT
jgi:hypothetical protein